MLLTIMRLHTNIKIIIKEKKRYKKDEKKKTFISVLKNKLVLKNVIL